MDISHITSHTLRSLLSLTDKKDQLLKSIEDVENEIANVLKGATAPVVRTVDKIVEAARSPKKTAGKKTSKVRPGRSGALKNRILDTLEKAGAEGMKVSELAKAVSSGTGNISTWLSTTGKSLTVRLQPGRYAVKSPSVVITNGVVPSQSKPSVKVEVKARPAQSRKAKAKSKLSPEGRAKIAAAMRARWAKQRDAQAPAKADGRTAKGSKKKN